MAIGASGCGTPARSWTFGQWRDWANCRGPGKNYGDQFIAWVGGNVAQPAPPALPLPPLKMSDHAYGTITEVQKLQGADNSAAGWFGAWLLAGNVGPQLAALLGNLVAKDAQLTASAVTTVGTSLNTGILGFLGQLSDPHFWLRAAEVILGLILIAIGVAKLTDAVPVATKIASYVR